MPADLLNGLRQAGHDVAGAVGEGSGGADDRPVLAAAAADNILLMFDLDFHA